MRASIALVYAGVAESPVPFITRIASPIALISPDATAHTEHTTLKAVRGVFCREGLAAFGATWRGVRWKITIGGELMREIKSMVNGSTLSFPFLERSIPKPVPV